MSLQLRTARVVRGDRELDVPVERVALGDVVRARPVEKVPSRPRQQRRPAHDVGAIVRLV